MVKIVRVDRKSAVLTPSSLACLSNIPTINLTSGCAHGCLYCYARGYSVYPGDNKLSVYTNIPEKLEQELALKLKRKPQAVYFSPSSDLFQPVEEVLELTHHVLSLLLSKGVGVALLTKGKIPERTLDLLRNHAGIVRAQIGIITADDSTRRIFEPNAAPVNVRLEQMANLIDAGIHVEARIIPIIPGITDTDESMSNLLEILADMGIKKVAISTLFLRPAIARNLLKYIKDSSIAERVMSFYPSKRMPVLSPHSSIVPLPLSLRKEIYQNVKRIAAKNGIEISICGCMNPDIGGNCNIIGNWPESPETHAQGNLFEQTG
jgi:DNA repair photolyase